MKFPLSWSTFKIHLVCGRDKLTSQCELVSGTRLSNTRRTLGYKRAWKKEGEDKGECEQRKVLWKAPSASRLPSRLMLREALLSPCCCSMVAKRKFQMEARLQFFFFTPQSRDGNEGRRRMRDEIISKMSVGVIPNGPPMRRPWRTVLVPETSGNSDDALGELSQKAGHPSLSFLSQGISSSIISVLHSQVYDMRYSPMCTPGYMHKEFKGHGS